LEERIVNNNPVGWFEIYVEDMPRAKAFYEAVLQTELSSLEMPEGSDAGDGADMEMWAFPMDMEAAGASGALVSMPGVNPGPGGVLVYFNAEDCAVEAARVAEHGGSVLQEKMSIGQYGFIALARDTEGNTIGFHSMG
jgi:uncharacterized protein